MKRCIVALLVLLLGMEPVSARKVKHPRVDYTPSWIEIREAESKRGVLVLRCDLRNLPNYGVKVGHAAVLRDSLGRNYKLLRAEGMEIGKETFMPSSGRLACTLYFEPVPDGVRKVDLIEEGNRPNGQVYGIHLYRSAPRVRPGLSADDFLHLQGASPQAPADSLSVPQPSWHYSPERYADMAFYRPGRARLVVHFDNLVPQMREEAGSCVVHIEDLVRHGKSSQATTLDNSGCGVFDLDLPGPQFVSIPEMSRNVFVQPGDTLHVYTTVEKLPGRKSRAAFAGNSESARINALWPHVRSLLSLPEPFAAAAEIMRVAELAPDSVMALVAYYGEQVCHLLEDDSVRRSLAALPLSPFGRDVLLTSALCEWVIAIEDLRGYYGQRRFVERQTAQGTILACDSSFVPLDVDSLYAPLLRHKQAVYDNPLVLCEAQQWVFANRTCHSPLFINPSTLQRFDGDPTEENANPYGLAGSLIDDLVYSGDLTGMMEHVEKEAQLDGVEGPSRRLEWLDDCLARCFTSLRHPVVAKALLTRYAALLQGLQPAIARQPEFTAPQQALLDKLVKPYRSNLVVMDFWGMGCGPCKSGMKRQREVVKALKGHRVRFVYVCDEKYSPRAVAEAWMKENKIEGKHVFVSHDEWNMLQGMFQFSAIPFAVLFDGEGRVVQRDFDFRSHMQAEYYEKLAKQLLR